MKSEHFVRHLVYVEGEWFAIGAGLRKLPLNPREIEIVEKGKKRNADKKYADRFDLPV